MKKFVSIILAMVIVSVASYTAFAADSENPGDVEKLTATSLDKAVKLKWSKVTDDTGVEGYIVHYGTKPAKKKGDKYDKQVDVKNVVEYTVDDLENGTKYYFSVVAYDAAKNESIAWAPEASATPSADAGDSEDEDAPQVASAEATFKNEVKVVFSEEIVLPEEDAEDAFTIENDDTFEPLVVTEAKMDEEDETNKTVLLTTDDQEEGVKYLLTVGIDIKDKADNPIISGTSDTALFTGSAEEKPAEDDKAPEVTKVEAVDATHLIVSFNETIVLSVDPSENFEITVEGDKTKTLEVLGVELGNNAAGVEDASAIITTGPQEKVTYVVTVVDLEDEAGNKISDTKDNGKFEGSSETGGDGNGDGDGEADLVPPKDVANFLVNKVMEAKKYVVKLSWKIPTENKGDVKEQKIYMSGDKGQKYDDKATLSPEVEKYDVKDLTPGEYWFKITQKDAAGNESAGVVTKVVLSETGPELLGLLAASLWLGRVVTRKKRK